VESARMAVEFLVRLILSRFDERLHVVKIGAKIW